MRYAEPAPVWDNCSCMCVLILPLSKGAEDLMLLMALENDDFSLLFSVRTGYSFPWTASFDNNFDSNYSDTCWCPSSPPGSSEPSWAEQLKEIKPRTTLYRRNSTHTRKPESTAASVLLVWHRKGLLVCLLSAFISRRSLLPCHMLNFSWLSWDFYYAGSPEELQRGKRKPNCIWQRQWDRYWILPAWNDRQYK